MFRMWINNIPKKIADMLGADYKVSIFIAPLCYVRRINDASFMSWTTTLAIERLDHKGKTMSTFCQAGFQRGINIQAVSEFLVFKPYVALLFLEIFFCIVRRRPAFRGRTEHSRRWQFSNYYSGTWALTYSIFHTSALRAKIMAVWKWKHHL